MFFEPVFRLHLAINQYLIIIIIIITKRGDFILLNKNMKRYLVINSFDLYELVIGTLESDRSES